VRSFPNGREQEPAAAWQSGPGLHRLDALRALIICIDTEVYSVLDFLKIGASGFEITGCWANALEPDVAHAMHSLARCLKCDWNRRLRYPQNSPFPTSCVMRMD